MQCNIWRSTEWKQILYLSILFYPANATGSFERKKFIERKKNLKSCFLDKNFLLTESSNFHSEYSEYFELFSILLAFQMSDNDFWLNLERRFRRRRKLLNIERNHLTAGSKINIPRSLTTLCPRNIFNGTINGFCIRSLNNNINLDCTALLWVIELWAFFWDTIAK